MNNETSSASNGYLCFWHGKQVAVYADTSYAAQKKAATLFKAKKSYEVTVVLAERAGATMVHQAQDVCP